MSDWYFGVDKIVRRYPSESLLLSTILGDRSFSSINSDNKTIDWNTVAEIAQNNFNIEGKLFGKENKPPVRLYPSFSMMVEEFWNVSVSIKLSSIPDTEYEKLGFKYNVSKDDNRVGFICHHPESDDHEGLKFDRLVEGLIFIPFSEYEKIENEIFLFFNSSQKVKASFSFTTDFEFVEQGKECLFDRPISEDFLQNKRISFLSEFALNTQYVFEQI